MRSLGFRLFFACTMMSIVRHYALLNQLMIRQAFEDCL